MSEAYTVTHYSRDQPMISFQLITVHRRSDYVAIVPDGMVVFSS